MSRNAERLIRARNLVQGAAFWLVLGLAVAATLLTLLSALGAIPWLQLAATMGGEPAPWAGPALQIALTVVLLAMCAYLPANARIMQLERSHRKFHMTMEDVARAYRISHAADRDGVFSLSSEFDDMRQRIEHMREHPDLGRLEPEVIEIAAQMSRTSRDLAKVYSEERVERARTFLRQRQQEVATFRERIELAQRSTDELKRWMQDVEADERTAQTQIKRLEEDLREVLPGLGYDFDLPGGNGGGRERNVVSIPSKPNG